MISILIGSKAWVKFVNLTISQPQLTPAHWYTGVNRKNVCVLYKDQLETPPCKNFEEICKAKYSTFEHNYNTSRAPPTPRFLNLENGHDSSIRKQEYRPQRYRSVYKRADSTGLTPFSSLIPHLQLLLNQHEVHGKL